MRYTKRIVQKEKKVKEALGKVQLDFMQWRPAYQAKVKLKNIQKLEIAMKELEINKNL